MKERYWITQDYTTNAYNGNIKLKSVVVFSFFSLRELAMIPCSEVMHISVYKNMQKGANATATFAL